MQAVYAHWVCSSSSKTPQSTKQKATRILAVAASALVGCSYSSSLGWVDITTSRSASRQVLSARRSDSFQIGKCCRNVSKRFCFSSSGYIFPTRETSFSTFSVADAPTAVSANNGSTSTSQNNNDLDIFGPMVSNPFPGSSSAAQFSQVTGGGLSQSRATWC